MNSDESLVQFDSLWNYADPSGTESKFRAVLTALASDAPLDYRAQLLSQIARAQGLQQRFHDALATLKQAEEILSPVTQVAHVRILLETGRVYNSSNRGNESVPFFIKAFALAQECGQEYHAIDAAHMLAIVTKADDSLAWSEKAIALAGSTSDTRARGWLGSLYNNAGWTYFNMERYSDALIMFRKAEGFWTEKKREIEIGIAQWSIAKMLRFLGKHDEALVIQYNLAEHRHNRDNDSSGYIHEEIAECLHAMGRSNEAKPHFLKAWHLLKDDPWLRRDEAERLTRLRELGES